MSAVARGRRPEGHGVAPEHFYDAKEAKKYHRSSRMKHIQAEITNRAIELLALPARPCYILDIGCGSGLSGEALERAGHYWAGCDISASMLEVARQRSANREDEDDDDDDDDDGEGDDDDDHEDQGQEGDDEEEDPDALDEEYDDEEGNGMSGDHGGNDDADAGLPPMGDLLLADMGQGLPFRPASFDGAVSVSALQWLCYSDSSEQDPKLRLNRFFSTLYTVLKRDARAVLQFYPESAEQAVLIAQAASRVGFAGGLVIDYPNSSKAKKYYLCLSFERSFKVPTALGTGADAAAYGGGGGARGARFGSAGGGLRVVGRDRPGKSNPGHGGGKREKKSVKSVDWIMLKKERQRRQGKSVKADSKYTGRKRSAGF